MLLIGEADAGAVEEITACLDQAPSHGDINLDLAGITFIDLAALRAILQFRGQLIACGRSLTVVNASRPVTLLLRITGFDRLLLGSGESSALTT